MKYDPTWNAANAMEAKARELGVTGVSVCGIHALPSRSLKPHVHIVDRMECPAEPEGRGPSNTGTNYFAVVMSELGEMLSTFRDSGSRVRPLKTGELGFPGGRVTMLGMFMIYAAFSGGTTEQDLIIAEEGMRILVPQAV